MRTVLTALKLGKRLTAAAVSRGNGRNGLISSDGCKGGAGGRTRAGRAGLWHVPPRCRKRQAFRKYYDKEENNNSNNNNTTPQKSNNKNPIVD